MLNSKTFKIEQRSIASDFSRDKHGLVIVVHHADGDQSKPSWVTEKHGLVNIMGYVVVWDE